MRTFTEWMSFRNPCQAANKWVLEVEDGPNQEVLSDLFYEFTLDGPYKRGGKRLFFIEGQPKATLFELEAAGIRER